MNYCKKKFNYFFFIKKIRILPFLSTGSDGKLFNNLSSLIRSLFVSVEYRSILVFLISLKYFVCDVITPEIFNL